MPHWGALRGAGDQGQNVNPAWQKEEARHRGGGVWVG